MLLEVGIDEGQSVLDFGCGSGTYSLPAAKLVGKKGRIYSVDVNRGTLDNLSRKAEREGLENIVTRYRNPHGRDPSNPQARWPDDHLSHAYRLQQGH
jgi:ubiquinone/menaquinone biosynthesis C-methylase UbiE